MIWKRVLVIEDDPEVSAVVEGILVDEGWETVHACNGQEGLCLAEQLLPDLIILDLMMPVMDGFEAFRNLRSKPFTARIPIIVLSAINEFELGMHHSEQSIGARFNLPPPEAFIEKPIVPHLLRATIQAISP